MTRVFKVVQKGTYRAGNTLARPGSSHPQQRTPVLPPHPGHSEPRSSSARWQPEAAQVLPWHLLRWWMRGLQECTGRRTTLWPKRTAREKKTRRGTVAEGRRVKKKETEHHQERARVDYFSEPQSKKRTVPCFSFGAYHRHVSQGCPLSQHCPGSSRCLWIDLSPSVFLCLCLCPYSLVPMQMWNNPQKHLSCSGSLSSPLDFGLICALIINDLPVLRFCGDLKPLQLNIGDVNK